MTLKKLCLHTAHIAFVFAYLVSNQAVIAEEPIDFGLQVTNTYTNEADNTPAIPATTDHYYTLRREDATLLKYTPSANGEVLQEVADLSQIFSSVKSVKTGAFDGAKTVFIAGIDPTGVSNKLIKFQLGVTPADTQSNADTQREEFLLVDAAQSMKDDGHADFRDIAIDVQGNAFVTDVARHRVIRINQYTGQAAVEGTDYTVVAGTGVQGFSGDSQVANEAQLDSPNSIAFDRFGNLIIADTGNRRIRAVSAGNGGLINPAISIISTLVGNGIAAVPDSTPTGINEQLTANTDAGTPLSIAVDINNDLRYYDKDSEHWIRVTNDNNGDSPDNLNYTQRFFSRLAATTGLHGVNGVYNGAIVADWQQNNVTFLTDNLESVNSNIYAGATTDPENVNNHDNALDISYQNTIKEIEFDQQVKASSGGAYESAGLVDFLKDGSKFEIDFQPTDVAVGDYQVLFSITDDEGAKFFGNSLIATLRRTAVDQTYLELATLGDRAFQDKMTAYYDKDGKLATTERVGLSSGWDANYRNKYKVITTLNLSSHVNYDDWNSLTVTLNEHSNKDYYLWRASINGENTLANSTSPITAASLKSVSDTQGDTSSSFHADSRPALVEHFQVPDTCYAETWQWTKVDATDQQAAYMRPTELIAKIPFKCFKDKDQATDVALKPEYCDLAGDVTNTRYDSLGYVKDEYGYPSGDEVKVMQKDSSRLAKYKSNQYPGYRDAMHCYKDENGEIYTENKPAFSLQNVMFRSIRADDNRDFGSEAYKYNLLGLYYIENVNRHMQDSVLVTSYPLNYYIPNDESKISGRGGRAGIAQNFHNAWPGSYVNNRTGYRDPVFDQDEVLFLKYANGVGFQNSWSSWDSGSVRDYLCGPNYPGTRSISYYEAFYCNFQDGSSQTTAIPGNVYDLSVSNGVHYIGNTNEIKIDNYYDGRLLSYVEVNYRDFGELALLEWAEYFGPSRYIYKQSPEEVNKNRFDSRIEYSGVEGIPLEWTYLRDYMDMAPTVAASSSLGTFYLSDTSFPPYLDIDQINQEPTYSEYEHFLVKSVITTEAQVPRSYNSGFGDFVTDVVSLGVGQVFKGGLKIGGLKRRVSSVATHLKDFNGLIANFKITQDDEVKFERINIELTSLATGSLSSDKPTLTIQGKDSSPSLYKIVGSDTQPKIFEIEGSSYSVKVPKYIAIDTNGKIYYVQKDAEDAERDDSDVVLKEVHTLKKVYPPLNNTVPIDRTTIDAEPDATEDYYELTANITDSNHKMFVEYVAQYLASVSTIRPLSSTSQDAQIVFSDAYAGLPVDMVDCPVARKDVTSFNSRKADEVEKYLNEQVAAGKSAFTFEQAMGDVDFEIGTVFCRNTEWVSSDQVFDPEVQGIVYNPADDAGKRYRLVRVKASGAFGGITKTFSLTDDYSNLVNQAKAMDGATDITYIWAEQYRVIVNTTKSKASSLAKIRIGGEDGTIEPAYTGNGEFWIDKGTQVELLMPVTNAELQLEGYTFREQGQDDKDFDLANSTHSILTIDGVDYYNINIGGSQGVNNSANVTWDFGNKVYKYQVKIGEEFIPDVTATSDGVAIPAKAIQAIQGATHDTAFFVPLNAQTYVDQETGLVTPAPESPALTGKTNAYVWQNRSVSEGSNFKGAMYFTRPGVYQMEWLIGGADYPIEGTEGFQKLLVEVVVNWPDETDYIPHIGGTPDVPLEISESDGLKFKTLNYTETDNLTVDVDTLSFPEWYGETTKTYRSVLVFSQSKDDRPAQGNIDDEAVVVKVVKSRHWSNDLQDNVAVTIGSEILSDQHDSDLGHNGYLIPKFGDDGVDQAVYNAATYDRETRLGELFAVNQEKAPTDGDDDLIVVWYKRLGDTSDENTTPLIESKWPAWPHVAMRYAPQWPQGDRIVIASRIGSDGKKTSGAESRQTKFAPSLYSNLTLYNQPDKELPGYNPNEEHALITKSWRYRTETPVPDAAFALRNDLNNSNINSDDYTSQPYVLVQYRDRVTNKYGMNAYRVDTEDANTYDFDPGDNDSGFNYTFNYAMEVGQTVIAPYPLNNVIGANKLREIWGENVTDAEGNITQQTYWEDRNGTAWAISGGADAKLYSYFWYPVQEGFWHPSATVGDVVPFGYAGSIVSDGELNKGVSKASTHQIAYSVSWPENTPELRIGETLTFSGGEHKTDNPGIEGLPGAIGWASGEIIFDSLNPVADVTKTAEPTGFSARLSPVLREIKVSLPLSDFPDDMKPASKRTEVKDGVWYFTELHAGIKSRIYYDNNAGKLVLRGFVNGKTVGDDTLQAAPPADFILQANVLTNDDFHSITELSGINEAVQTAVTRLYALSQQPTISGNALYGREAPEVSALEYSGDYQPDYHLGLSRFLRGSDNRLLTVRGLGDITTRMQNGQLPAGLEFDDLELIDPASQYDFYSGNVDVAAGSLESAQKAATEAGKAYAAATASQSSLLSAVNWNCKEVGDTYYTTSGAIGTSGFEMVQHTCTSSMVSDLEAWSTANTTAREASLAHKIALAAEKAARVAAVDNERSAYASSLSTLSSLPNPEASELPYGFTVEDLNTINALQSGEKLVRIKEGKGHIPASLLGSGLALMTNPNLLDPTSDATANFEGGYVVVAENNDPAMDGNPVSLHIVKINDKPFRGMIKTVFSENVFDEKITLRHTGDFGGNPEDLIFDWRYIETSIANSDLRLTKGYKVPTQDADPSCPIPRNMPDSSTQWKPFVDERPGNKKGLGWNELTFGNATGKDVLVDNSFFVRYIHKDCDIDFDKIVDADAPASCSWSGWTGAANGYPCDTTPEYQPQLVTGWVKRVTENVNQYDARINDFSTDGSPATYVSMIQQAGQMHEGDVALNADKDVIENMGLIELYQTVLNRAEGLSIDAGQSSVGVTQALQNAASRISQFYSLLGNEAYSDALDPTIGFASNSREYGSLAPTIFTFQNQLSSLGEEELALLRGRAEKGAKPAYNRLLWNFTNSDGEAAYALSYNIQDVDKNGSIDAADGRAMYPQGHGDAWGHYMSGLTTFYDLLRHPNFTWESRSESYQIEGVTLDVDYLDERRFAEAAAYKAKVGSEVVTQTYRDSYVEDPDGQWQGYKDTDASRAWGVDGWARRAHQGAYYDWVTAGALIPAVSKKTGIQKIDRTTVGELQEISAQGIKVLTEMAQVDNGLNPLGLLPDVVPFDIAPGTGETHFEQVVERAETAIANATTVFDYANDLKHRLRKVADTQQEFAEQVEVQDREYRNRLIEVFGTPYAGTIGAGKAYPEGYQGPDYKFYQYIDVAEVSDKTLPVQNEVLQVFFSNLVSTSYKAIEDDNGKKSVEEFKSHYDSDFPPGFSGSMDLPDVEVTMYPLSSGIYSFSAPGSWEQRQIPGALQSALIDMVKADVDLRLADKTYGGLLDDLWRIERNIKARYDLKSVQVEVNSGQESNVIALASAQAALSILKATVEYASSALEDTTKLTTESLPQIVGTSNDVASAPRGMAWLAKSIGDAGMATIGTGIDVAGLTAETIKNVADLQLEMDIIDAEYDHDIQVELSEIDDLFNQEPEHRLRLFRARENLRQTVEKYRSILGKGLALLDERDAFHKKVAFKTHGKRYQDMAFRINRTEASQKYRAAFDLAAKYVYLAAKAYDYDTNLSDKHPASAQPILSEVIRTRSLGQFFEGEPVVGMGGLADVLAQLKANYAVLKTQMGINNPQLESTTLSLREELFRIKESDDPQSATSLNWKKTLRKHWVKDLWTEVPEFRTHMRPFAAESEGEQVALVIPFSSNIISGKNFFGRAHGAGDNAFDASNFATRIHSVGVSFTGYNGLELSETPRAYLVPVGQDVMYVPDSNELQTREWSVKDQKIPTPLLTGSANVAGNDWLPLSSLDDSSGQLRRHSRFRVYDESDAQGRVNDSTRLYGRSVWNNRWLLVVPIDSLGSSGSFTTLFYGNKVPGSSPVIRDGNGISDIKLTFKTYAYSGD